MIQQTIFECHDLEQHTQALADFLPNGRLFAAKNITDSVYRMFLRGLAHTEQDAESLLCLLDEELNIQTTTDFIEEWEKTVGIPDDCFSTNQPIDVRRQQILIKLASLGVQIEQDFIDLAALYGVQIAIDSGLSHGAFPYTFPIIFFGSIKEARFTMVVFYAVPQAYTFTYTFPIVFGSSAIPIIQCLFKKLVPSNVDVMFLQVDESSLSDSVQFSDAFSNAFA